MIAVISSYLLQMRFSDFPDDFLTINIFIIAQVDVFLQYFRGTIMLIICKTTNSIQNSYRVLRYKLTLKITFITPNKYHYTNKVQKGIIPFTDR